MKTLLLKLGVILLTTLTPFYAPPSQDFQGQAVYFSKTKMELGNWGARLSEAQKKQVQARLKNRLEKTYIMNFNRAESVFYEEDKLDAMSGATVTSVGVSQAAVAAQDLYKKLKPEIVKQMN